MSDMSGGPWDLDSRPQSYWEVADPYRAILANIKGERRKQQARKLLEQEAFGELDEYLTRISLSEDDRRVAGRVHPLLMGGEYLPDYLPGEVEIARVSLASTTGDVAAVRARPAGSAIDIRVVDEYMDLPEEDEPRLGRPIRSDRPLSMGELVKFLDSTPPLCLEEGDGGLVWGPLEMNLCGWIDPAEAASFVWVDSDFYPQLGPYYAYRVQEWIERKRHEHQEF